MNKRKLRFNAVDAILILVLAVVAFVLLQIFVFDGDNGDASGDSGKRIQYTIYVKEMDEYCEDLLAVGQPVTDAIEKRSIGTVCGIEVSDTVKMTFDYESSKETEALVPGKINAKITIEAYATDTGSAFTVDGCTIRVGNQYSIMLPEIYCTGYCIDINDSIQ